MMEHVKRQQRGSRSPATKVSKCSIGADSYMMAHVRAVPRASPAGMGRSALEIGPKSSTRLSFLDRLADAEAKDNERMGGDEVASAALVGGGRDVARKAAAAAEAEAEAEVETNPLELLLHHKAVSRKHCELYYCAISDTFKLLDRSLNGVFVNRVKVSHAPHNPQFWY